MSNKVVILTYNENDAKIAHEASVNILEGRVLCYNGNKKFIKEKLLNSIPDDMELMLIEKYERKN